MNWHKAVIDAATHDALLRVVNEYLLSYPEEYWSWIPREARPKLVATTAELQQHHRRLSELLAVTTSPNIRLQDLAVFFLQASARAIELADDGCCCNDEQDEDAGDSRKAS
jgi:hypothetical protein